MSSICSENNLCDIWRSRNPQCSRFTWRSTTPFIQIRLHYFLIGNHLQTEIINTDIIPGKATDHSAVTFTLDSQGVEMHGPSFWRFNSSLLTDFELYFSTERELYHLEGI